LASPGRLSAKGARPLGNSRGTPGPVPGPGHTRTRQAGGPWAPSRSASSLLRPDERGQGGLPEGPPGPPELPPPRDYLVIPQNCKPERREVPQLRGGGQGTERMNWPPGTVGGPALIMIGRCARRHRPRLVSSAPRRARTRPSRRRGTRKTNDFLYSGMDPNGAPLADSAATSGRGNPNGTHPLSRERQRPPAPEAVTGMLRRSINLRGLRSGGEDEPGIVGAEDCAGGLLFSWPGVGRNCTASSMFVQKASGQRSGKNILPHRAATATSGRVTHDHDREDDRKGFPTQVPARHPGVRHTDGRASTYQAGDPPQALEYASRGADRTPSARGEGWNVHAEAA